MADRLDLQAELENVLGSENVYFQPPGSVKMSYPAIRYNLSEPDLKRANNKIYRKTKAYEGVVIDSDPDTDIPDVLLEHFEMIRFGRPYTADNLNHYPFTLYY